MATSCDVAVVGLGLVGAAALRHLSADGRRCIGVGPTEPLDWSTHDGVFASHYDSGRITRRLDKRREWALLAGRAIDVYSDIEATSGIAFHSPVGVVMADVDPSRFKAISTVAEELDVAFERFEAGEAFGDDRVSIPDGATVLREPPPGGFIDPRRTPAAQLVIARGQGAGVIADEAVRIEQSGGGWSVHTREGITVEASQVVIAAVRMPTSSSACRAIALIDVVAETVVMARLSGEEEQRLAGLPSIIVDGHDDHLYSVPPTEYPDGHVYVKLGVTRHNQWVLSASERRDWIPARAMRTTWIGCVGCFSKCCPGCRPRPGRPSRV